MATVRRHFQGAGEVFVGSASITIAASVPEASEDIEITEANAAVSDVISVSLAAADMEASLVVMGAWCSEAGKIKVRIGNHNAAGGSNLTGGTATVYYSIVKTA